MNSLTVILLALLPAFCSVHAVEDFKTRFQELQKQSKDAEVERFLGEAEQTEKDNPEFYALAGNYWWQLSQKLLISTKPAQKGDFVIGERGKEVGSISTLGAANPELRQKALSLLKQGFHGFPMRLDIALGLAHVQKEMGLDDECLETLEALLKTASDHSARLRWTDNGQLPEEAGKFIPESLQSYSRYFYEKNTKADDARAERLCRAIISAFPDHPYAFNALAALFDAHGDLNKALELLLQAQSKAPEDALVLLNLGDAFRKLHRDQEASATFQKILQLQGATAEEKREALARIDAVRKAKAPDK